MSQNILFYVPRSFIHSCHVTRELDQTACHIFGTLKNNTRLLLIITQKSIPEISEAQLGSIKMNCFITRT